MIDYPQILPECNADTLLVNMLIGATTAHNRGINTVFATLKKFESNNKKAIGVIDDDKRKDKDPYYKKYKLKKEYLCFKHLQHPNGIQELIVTHGKGFEKFIMRVAEEADVQHKLLKDFDRLKILAKSEAAKTDTDLKNLLNTLIQKNPPTLIYIREILMKHTSL
jgi:hypothetical protein